jgi:isoleucyl-tRNA synthetase
LRFFLIASYARVHPLSEQPDWAETTEVAGQTLGIAVSSSGHPKCSRCWHHREDVGSNTDHPGLCGRCIDNVAGEGEQRRFA